MQLRIVFCLMMFFSLSCMDEKKKTQEEEVSPKVETELKEENVESTPEKKESTPEKKESTPSTSSSKELGDIAVGQSIQTLLDKHPEDIKKAIIKNGKDKSDVYKYSENDKLLANIFPDDAKDPSVLMIEVLSSEIVTKNNLKVGSTYGDLKKAYKEVIPHGSELEGQTSVKVGNHQYMLDFQSYDYDMDAQAIPNDAKITSIIIR